MSDKRGIDAFVVYKCISPVGRATFSTSKLYQGINVLTTTPQPWASPAPENKNRPLCKRRWKKFFGEMFGGLIFSFYLCTHKRGQRCLSVVKDLSHGVMASTTGFGSVSQGSNPCRTTAYHAYTVARVSQRA